MRTLRTAALAIATWSAAAALSSAAPFATPAAAATCIRASGGSATLEIAELARVASRLR